MRIGSLSAVRKRQRGFLGAVAAAGAVAGLPLADWRVPLTSVTVTGSTSDAANSTALSASPANKDMPVVQVAANGTATFDFILPSGVAAPGAILNFTTSVGSPNARTVTAAYDPAGGTTFTAIPFTPIATIAGTPNSDQIVDVPAMPAGSRLRITYATTALHSVRMKLMQLQTDPLLNDIHAFVSMSIGITSTAGGQAMDAAQAAIPGRDPIILATARSGAKIADMRTEQLVGIVQPRAYIKRVIMDFGPNNFFANGKTFGNYSQTEKDGITADIAAVLSWASTNDRRITYIAPNFVDPANFDSGAATNILQENVVESGAGVSIGNQANGMRPVIQSLFLPTIKASAVPAWNSTYDAPAFDGYQGSLLSWDLWKQLVSGMTAQDGTHPVGYVTALYRVAVADAYQAAVTGSLPKHYLERQVAACEPHTNAAQKNRLYLGFNSLFDTADSAALAARAALKTRIDNIATTWAEPAGQTAPASLPGIAASYDFDDMGTLWTDDASTIPAKHFELVRSITDKGPNGYKLANTSAATSPPFRQPRCDLGTGLVDRGLFFDGTTAYLDMPAGLYGALNAANQPFILGFTYQPAMISGATPRVLLAFTATGGLTIRFSANSSKIALVGSAVLGTEATDAALNARHVGLVTYDGTTIKFRRDGVETISAAWNKAAQTATAGRIGASSTGFGGRMKGLHVITGAWTAATRDALEARLRAKAGV